MTPAEQDSLLVRMAVQDVKIVQISDMVDIIRGLIEKLSFKFDDHLKYAQEREEKLKAELEARSDRRLDEIEARLDEKVSRLYTWLLGFMGPTATSMVFYWFTHGKG